MLHSLAKFKKNIFYYLHFPPRPYTRNKKYTVTHFVENHQLSTSLILVAILKFLRLTTLRHARCGSRSTPVCRSEDTPVTEKKTVHTPFYVSLTYEARNVIMRIQNKILYLMQQLLHLLIRASNPYNEKARYKEMHRNLIQRS